MNTPFRTESDSMGAMEVPKDAYYGAQTARAMANFPISGLRFPRAFIRSLGLIKKHAARVNASLGLLPPEMADAIAEVAAEVGAGRHDEEFVVDVFQTGSGTSTNMNANEVIANRATELLGGRKGDRAVHPNDHVNCGQSSNDVIPTAMHVAALDGILFRLVPAVRELREELLRKAEDFREVIKTGRTHLQDATPVRLGQEFGGYASQVEHGLDALLNLRRHLGEVALGGTAVGTGLNTHPEFARRVVAELSEETGLALSEARNHFAAQGGCEACVAASGVLRCLAVSLIKIANDVRLMGSGPRCGIGELRLPPTQPGSSIMPGKVNPVMCEMVIQVGAQVMGNDVTVAFGGSCGQLELNTMLPVVTHNLLQSIEILATSTRVFSRRCIAGLEADTARCEALIEQSLAMGTALAPVIGYERAAVVAKIAHETGRTVRDVAAEESGLSSERLADLLDPRKQTGA